MVWPAGHQGAEGRGLGSSCSLSPHPPGMRGHDEGGELPGCAWGREGPQLRRSEPCSRKMTNSGPDFGLPLTAETFVLWELRKHGWIKESGSQGGGKIWKGLVSLPRECLKWDLRGRFMQGGGGLVGIWF